MFMRPGFAALVARKETHVPDRNANPEFVMADIHDADMWYQSTTGTRREIGSAGTIRDVAICGNPYPTRLYTHRFGLQLTLNMDW